MRRTIGIALAAMLGLAGCGGGGGGSTPSAGTPGSGQPGPTFEGFDFGLAEGDFWEYRWTSEQRTVAPGLDDRTWETGTFRVTLGAPEVIDGVNAFPLILTGRSAVPGGSDFAPRWRYLAVANDRILGSEDGTSLTVLFDAWRGAWAGSGYFAEFPDDILFIAQERIVDGEAFMTGSVLAVSRSTSRSQCEIIAGIPICGTDDPFTFIEREYYLPGIGPVGYYFHVSQSFGGPFPSSHLLEHNLGLVASSLRGDVLDHVLEAEPNDGRGSAQALALSGVAAAVVGDVAPGDAGVTQTVTIVPPGAQLPQNVTVSLEDWYRFTLAEPRSVTITLAFDDGANQNDLDLYLFGAVSGALVGYSVSDNRDSAVPASERITLTLAAGTYAIAVDAFATAGRVGYRLELR